MEIGKQPQTTKSTTGSEATAMAATCILAEYVKALRESVGLPLSEVRIRCDNRAAIVLATGEGTWNTKALVNRVSWIREAVKWGEISVEYVPTHDQLADNFTKLLPGVAQIKATHNLSLEPLNYEINLCFFCAWCLIL